MKKLYLSYCKYLGLIFLALSLSACFPSKDEANQVQEILMQGRTMGTTYHIKVSLKLADYDVTKLQEKIDALLIEVNQQMSTYIEDSELSLLNKNMSTEPVEISPELSTVIAEAIRLGKQTKGQLDVTVGPLVNLWGFGPDFRPERVPTIEELAQAGERVGIDNINLVGNQLTKDVSTLYIDLSTIAKGYGVDKVADLLESLGISNYLVEIGGEMRLKGFKHTGELWHIAVERPVFDGEVREQQAYQILVPGDNGVATSGDYRNYHEYDGIRYSHIIDPKTGKPITHKLVSVTVIAPLSMTADGLSTALMVMGAEQGLEFADKHDIAAMFIIKTDDGFEERDSVKFRQYLK